MHTMTNDTWYTEERNQALGRQRYIPEHQTTGLLLFSYITNFSSMTFLCTTCYLLISKILKKLHEKKQDSEAI